MSSLKKHARDTPEAPPPDIQAILTDKQDPDGKRWFFVKFTKKSYAKCDWVSADDIDRCKNSEQLLANYSKRTQGLPPDACFNPHYLEPEKIIGSRNNNEYLVKWRDLPSEETTWETAEELGNSRMIEEFCQRNRVPECGKRRSNTQEWIEITHENAPGLNDDQIAGANALLSRWCAHQSVIVEHCEKGDVRMDAIQFLEHLVVKYDVRDPFMIVAPSEVLKQWMNKCRLADLKSNILWFCGTTSKRELMKKHEIFYPKTDVPNFKMMFTTCEFAVKEAAFFEKIAWQCIIVDEAQRTKSNQLKIISAMSKLSCKFKMLFTNMIGTCTETEMETVVRFLMGSKLDNIKKLEKDCRMESDEAIFGVLGDMLQSATLELPCTETDKPQYKEYVVECGVTVAQRQCFEKFYQDHKVLDTEARMAKGRASELLKLCNHPVLLEEKTATPTAALLERSGKLLFLDKFLLKMKDKGGKVVVCSQTVEMLDIIEKVVELRGFQFVRVDSTVRATDRQNAINRFNSQKEVSVFLVCAAAIGQGLRLSNLTSVVLYDSSTDPSADTKIIAKCGRCANAYRLITAFSFESILFHAIFSKKQQNGDSVLSDSETLRQMVRSSYLYLAQSSQCEERVRDESVECTLARAQIVNVSDLPSEEQAKPDGPPSHDMVFAQEDSFEADNSSEFEWSREKIHTLMSLLLKFGWGRWKSIRDIGNFDVSSQELRSVCRLLLKKLLDSSSEEFPIPKMLYAEDDSNKEWEDNFAKQKKRCFDSSVSQSANWKLGTLDTLYFINQAVTTCPNPPSELVIPQVHTQDEPDWWSDEDDKRLLYGVFKYGYIAYKDIKFTNKPGQERPRDRFLTARIKAIVTGLNQCYSRFKEISGQDVPFSHEVLVQALSAWTKKEQRLILSHLSMCGLMDIKKLYKIVGLKDKDLQQFTEFVDRLLTVMKALEAKEHVKQDDLPEKITLKQAQKVQSRIRLFEKLRSLDDINGTAEEKFTFFHLRKNGLRDLSKYQVITRRFGTENTEKEVLQFAQEKAHMQVPKETVPSVVPHTDTHVVEGVQLPIRIGNKLVVNKIGHCVYDRPRFHCERYIYPVGFESMRQFTSIINPHERVWYRSSIRDDGGDGPIFRVEIPNTKYVFEGNAPSKPWSDVMREVDVSKKRHRMPCNKAMAVSGPENFGLSAPAIRELMAKLPGADRCTRFTLRSKPQQPAEPKPANPPAPRERSRSVPTRHIEEEIVARPQLRTLVTEPFFKASHPLSPVTRLSFNFRSLMEQGGDVGRDQASNDRYTVDGSLLLRILREEYRFPRCHNDPLGYIMEYMDEF